MCFYSLVVLRSAPGLTRLTCDMAHLRHVAAAGAPLSLTGVSCLETLVLANEAPQQLSRPFMLSKLVADNTNTTTGMLYLLGNPFCPGFPAETAKVG